MSRHPDSIRGVTFKNNPNMVEHQWFPREYFSGSDVVIYFGDVFLSELNGLQFTLEERVLPVFSYASHTWDEVARGSRYVTGSFRIPFIEAGYLETILTHIGTYTTDGEKVKPKMAYLLGDEKVPNWCADLKMDSEGLFNKYKAPVTNTGHKGTTSKGATPKSAFTVSRTLTPGSVSDTVATAKAALFDKTQYVTPVSQFLIDRYGNNNAETCMLAAADMVKYDNATIEKFNRATQETLNEIFKHDKKERFKDKVFTGRIDEKTITRKLSELSSDGIFDSVSSSSLQVVKNWFSYRNSSQQVKSELYDNSYKTVLDSDIISMLAGSGDTRKYDPAMFIAACKWQTANGYQATGDITGEQITALLGSPVLRTTPEETQNKYSSPDGFTRYAERVNFYEHEVWGRDSSKDRDRRFQTFFYTDRWRYNGEDGQAILKKTGFDIYITYGPAADAQKYNTYHHELGINAPAMPTYNFRTTVKAIRNIQLTSSGQTIMADGQPIAEEYTFIAQDLD